MSIIMEYLAWHYFKSMVNGDVYEGEIPAFLNRQLSGKESGSIDIMAIHTGFNAYGFKLDSLSVDNVWYGTIQFNGEELPYNHYEVNTPWRNRSEGKTEKRCFLYS